MGVKCPNNYCKRARWGRRFRQAVSPGGFACLSACAQSHVRGGQPHASAAWQNRALQLVRGSSRGKNEAHRTRAAGKIPAVVYGAFKDPIAVAVNPREITKITHSSTGFNTIFTLAIVDGESTPVMVVDQQLDPIRSTLLHVDFKRIDLTKRIRVTVPVSTAGEPQGVKVQGGLLEIISRAIEIECLPDDIPEHFVIDVTELMV